eukprot:3688278-Rhodomonas_salina.1
MVCVERIPISEHATSVRVKATLVQSMDDGRRKGDGEGELEGRHVAVAKARSGRGPPTLHRDTGTLLGRRFIFPQCSRRCVKAATDSVPPTSALFHVNPSGSGLKRWRCNSKALGHKLGKSGQHLPICRDRCYEMAELTLHHLLPPRKHWVPRYLMPVMASEYAESVDLGMRA